MTARVSEYKHVLYSRDYTHDAPPQTDLVKRVALASVPFLSLHGALRAPLSILMGTLRVWHADFKDILGTVVSVVALVATIFQHRLGMIVTAIHDIILETKKLFTDGEAAKSLIKILNHALFLTLICAGGLELSIVAFLLQAVVNVIQSMDEFDQGRWIEGVANLLIAGTRLYQSHVQHQHLQRRWAIEKAMKNIFVGELHEKWRFPSDHLPVGIEVNGVKVISWNVLNNAFMEWVTTRDSQGLNGSMISDLDVPVNDQGLTQRDLYVAEMVQDMMSKGQVVALQECSEPFLQHMQARLDSNWGMVRSFEAPKKDQDVILYNKDALTLSRAETTRDSYPSSPNRPIQMAEFSNQLRIINAHIPGDFDKPGWEEFAEYVHQVHTEGTTTVALGDNNFERDRMIAAYQKAGFTDFSLHSPWKTNIDPTTKDSKGIDHLFVVGSEDSRDLTPEEVVTGANLPETIQLLNGA